MKKTFLTSIFTMAAALVFAQNYMVVNTQEIFKSIDSYNKAVAELDSLNSQYQQRISAAYEKLEDMYSSYQTNSAYMTTAERQTSENNIIEAEQKIAQFEDDVFGQNGEMIKKRIELLKPIQDNVFNVIDKYAKENNFDLVLDIASNPTILYYLPERNKTEQIINQLK